MAMETEHFGSFLRKAREDRRIALEDIAASTKLSLSALRLIEAGHLDDLPPEVFVRGFVRSYARALGISDLQPIELFDEVVRERKAASEAALRAAVPVGEGDAQSAPRSAGPMAAARRAGAALAGPLLPATWGAGALGEPGVPGHDGGDGPVSRRGYGIAVFVVIVLLIATITLSYFISQPPRSGEGLSMVPRTPASAAWLATTGDLDTSPRA